MEEFDLDLEDIEMRKFGVYIQKMENIGREIDLVRVSIGTQVFHLINLGKGRFIPWYNLNT